MIFTGAGILWAAITLLTICLCKIASEKPDPINHDLCEWCERLPIFSNDLCEPCWETGQDDWEWDFPSSEQQSKP